MPSQFGSIDEFGLECVYILVATKFSSCDDSFAARKSAFFLHTLFLENEEQPSKKNYRAILSADMKSTCKISANLEQKQKNNQNRHLSPFMTSFFNCFIHAYSMQSLVFGKLLSKDVNTSAKTVCICKEN